MLAMFRFIQRPVVPICWSVGSVYEVPIDWTGQLDAIGTQKAVRGLTPPHIFSLIGSLQTDAFRYF